jgi:hypothetical protein
VWSVFFFAFFPVLYAFLGMDIFLRQYRVMAITCVESCAFRVRLDLCTFAFGIHILCIRLESYTFDVQAFPYVCVQCSVTTFAHVCADRFAHAQQSHVHTRDVHPLCKTGSSEQVCTCMAHYMQRMPP